MTKLFIFGIGGTGSRVIKSLMMLLASGVKINASEIIPIIIDVDKPNEDLTRTIEILKLYESINTTLVRPGYSGFFETKISNLNPIQGLEFKMEVEDVQGKKFEDYIDHHTLDDENRKLMDLLFTKENLALDMQQGFQGNPNLGSVVLNQFKTNKDFINFASKFESGDRIFIISSIHGGTGSSGFPLLVKNLRNASVPLPKSEFIKNALIGAITVLPYFNLNIGKINSNDFTSKAKAALEYYVENVNPELNSLYYIGYDAETPRYENHVGGTKQKNPAHFVEFAAAMSIIDFMKQPDGSLAVKGKRFLEFGTDEFVQAIDFKSLGSTSYEMVFEPMTKYFFFLSYLSDQLKESIGKQPWNNRGSKKDRLTNDFFNGSTGVYTNIVKFNDFFKSWLEELSKNRPAFMPFNLSSSKNFMRDGVSNITFKISWNQKSYVRFDDRLNKHESRIKGLSKEQKFVELFNRATDELVSNKQE